MWHKYRKESKQTICIIGVLTLAAKLAKADGHFSDLEEEDILKTIPHRLDQKVTLKRILKEASNDSKSFEYDALRIKELLDDQHPEFLEFIVAVLYKLAHSDHVYSDEEDQFIKKIALIFEINKRYNYKFLGFMKNFLNLFNFKFKDA